MPTKGVNGPDWMIMEQLDGSFLPAIQKERKKMWAKIFMVELDKFYKMNIFNHYHEPKMGIQKSKTGRTRWKKI